MVFTSLDLRLPAVFPRGDRQGLSGVDADQGSCAAPIAGVITSAGILIEMPEMTSIDPLRMLRGDERHRALPVIIVSSRGSDEDQRRGMEAGADA